jgi:hypothetical protein
MLVRMKKALRVWREGVPAEFLFCVKKVQELDILATFPSREIYNQARIVRFLSSKEYSCI